MTVIFCLSILMLNALIALAFLLPMKDRHGESLPLVASTAS